MSALEILYEWFKEQLSRAFDSSEEADDDDGPGADGESDADDESDAGGVPNADDGPDADDESDDEDTSKNVVNTQKAFVETQIKAMLDALGLPQSLQSRVVTVRKRFCEIHRYLRPVYAEPSDLNPYLTRPDQQTPFNVEFGDDDEKVFGAIPPHMRVRTEEAFLCIHRVDDNFNGRATEAATTVAERLTRFWQNNLAREGDGAGLDGYDFVKSVDELNDLKEEPGKALFCVFAGSLRPAEDGSRSELKALFGAYLVWEKGWVPAPKALDQAFEQAAELFRGLEFISQMDSRLFELQGLRRMATLLPKFGKEDVPRSDKISAALWSLKELLDHHLVGRPEWEGGEEPKLFYLSASFERVQHGWFPRLEVYPHAYRKEFPLVSLLVSHAGVPSTSKFLLKTYLDRHSDELSMSKTGVKLDPAFADLFNAADLNMPEPDAWRDRVMRGDEATCLHMVEQDEEIAKLAVNGKRNPWEALNHSVDSSGTPSRSLLAFVIEGEKRPDGRAFPRGILALESSAIDAFSDQDIGALRAVVKAFGSLVRLITHDNACLEYRTRLSEAFHAELRNKLPEDPEAEARFRKFVFSVKKIDGTQFNDLLDDAIPNSNDSERIWELLNLEDEDVRTLTDFKKTIIGFDDDKVPNQTTANKIVADRVEWALEEVKKLVEEEELVGKLNKNIVEFLFACTENFQWSAYLSSMAQTLGDRATKDVPKFQMMTPGYSAARMFMASVSQELRQVVKLSEFSKLRRERTNYKTYVRYLLVNSARMPVNGFAFDGVGWRDPRKKLKMKERFGALVSDLISAEKRELDLIKTFVTLLCDSIDDEKFTEALHTQVFQSICGLFDHGTSLWQQVNFEGKHVGIHIREPSRLPRSRNALNSGKYPKLDRALSIYSYLFGDDQADEQIKNILFDVPSDLPPADVFCTSLYQVSHRDLNARNLTWSSALGTFLMIDFEHVGRGYSGHDQTRLWINAICDLYAEAIPYRVPETRYDAIFINVDDLINNTRYFLKYLAKNTFLEKRAVASYIAHFAPDVYPSDMRPKNLTNITLHDREITREDYFVTFFVSLLINLSETEGISALLVYSFYCNALTEFQYSCEDIDEEKLREILDKLGDLDAADSRKIHNALESESSLNAATQGIYFRHLTAARLLKVAFEALTSLKAREARRS